MHCSICPPFRIICVNRPMSSENPYEAPKSLDIDDVPTAPLSSGWRVEGKCLYVSSVCILPMIDVYSGALADRMTMHWLTVRMKPWWMVSIPVLLALLLLFLLPVVVIGFVGLFLTGGILGLILCGVIAHFLPSCTMRAFFTRETMRRRNLIPGILFGLFVVYIIAPMFLRRPLPGLMVLPTMAGWLWLIGMIYLFFIRRRLTCRRKVGETFEIRGVHPKALRQLAEIQTEREKQALQADDPL